MRCFTITTAFSVFLYLVLPLMANAEVPQLINYQGYLTKAGGNPVNDGEYIIRFTIWGHESSTAPSDSLWSSGDRTINIVGEHFIYHLGDTISLPNDLFAADTVRYLGMRVGDDPEISPRTRLVSVPYAYQALRSDTAGLTMSVADEGVTSSAIQDGTIQLNDLGQNGASFGQILKWNGSQWGLGSDETGEGVDPHWVVIDSVLYTIKQWGIVRGGAGNLIAPGPLWTDDLRSTITNLGIACTTGYEPATCLTISGGYGNRAEFGYTTVGGGASNRILDYGGTIGGGEGNRINGYHEPYETLSHSTIGGGKGNMILDGNGFIGGGWYNTIEGPDCSIVAGSRNTAAGPWGTIGGGGNNSVGGYYCTVAGGVGNNASGNGGTICGGRGNTVSNGEDVGNTVCGGEFNSATADDGSFIGGGGGNNASGIMSVIAGGDGNRVSGHWSGVVGGYHNYVDASYSAILGGRENTITADADYSYLFGINSTLSWDSTFRVDMPHIDFRGDLKVLNESYNRLIQMTTSPDGGGSINTYGPNGYLNARLTNIDGFPDNGSVSVRDASGNMVAQMAVNPGNEGHVRVNNTSEDTRAIIFVNSEDDNGAVITYGTNGNRNAVMGHVTDYPNNGSVFVVDESDNDKAGIYVNSSGEGVVWGHTKSFRMPNPRQSGTEVWYTCPEGPEAAAYVRGTGRLINGMATVALPQHFADVASPDGVTAHLTPLAPESKGLAAIERSPEQIIVKELNGGSGTYDFDYYVMAVRKGHEDYQVIRPALDLRIDYPKAAASDEPAED
jgi:hypothetical protein